MTDKTLTADLQIDAYEYRKAFEELKELSDRLTETLDGRRVTFTDGERHFELRTSSWCPILEPKDVEVISVSRGLE